MRVFSLATALISAGFVLGSPTPGILPSIPGVPGVPLPGVPDILPGIPAVAIPNVPLPGIPTLPLSGRSDATEVNTTTAERVSSAVYNDLVFYFKYASSAYSVPGCPRPNGNVFVYRIFHLLSDTNGYIARDDKKKEIVVALRGSLSIQNFFTDATIIKRPFVSPGVITEPSVLVHKGFLDAWNTVAVNTINVVRSQLASHPGYTIVVTGHSLGGSLASLAGISLKRNFPHVPLRLYTYGQPRTGDPNYALLLNREVGSRNIYRGVNALDGVPTIIPTRVGYRHHGTEYWTFPYPSTAENTRSCDPSGEDPSCSARIISTGINADHTVHSGYNTILLLELAWTVAFIAVAPVAVAVAAYTETLRATSLATRLIDFNETFAPNIRTRLSTLGFILSLGATLDSTIEQADAKNAYLNGVLLPNEIIYMEVPLFFTNFRSIEPNPRVKPWPFACGVPFMWHEELCDATLSLNTRSDADHAIFYYFKPPTNYCLLGVATDDFTHVADSNATASLHLAFGVESSTSDNYLQIASGP
ncbi:hypothetical protein MD484_g5008, partial [Candolleomyces efflorescens]